ncbi:MAG: DUF2254 family protein [Pseudomonadales bacterium]
MNSPQLSLSEHRPLAVPIVIFLSLMVVSVVLMVAGAILGKTSLAPLTSPVEWLGTLDVEAAFDIVSNAAEVVAAVLAIAITVVAIVVELAANRYSHEITRLFLREPVNLLVLGLFVITTLQCVWTSAVMAPVSSDAVLPHAGFAITLALVVLCLLLLVPYIYFVFAFLSPISVIQRISRDAYRRILRVRIGNVPDSQSRVEEAVDQLQDVARSAIAQGDRSIAMAAVDAMARLLMDYVEVRDGLPDDWFRVTDAIASDPDFVALAPETMTEVQTQGLWLERKLFRRYLSLLGQTTGQSGDVANVIGINTQQIGSALGADRPQLLELCRRSFNSYLRTTINARDPRTAYFLMNQYRVLGEQMLKKGRESDAVKVAEYLQEYGHLANRMGIPFLLETAAYDVMQLIELAVEGDAAALDPLLGCFLALDQEITGEDRDEIQLGVRRAQIQLATFFLERGDDERTNRIIDDLRGEKRERLDHLRSSLLSDDRAQFWELMDRGANFRYLAPERRGFLAEVFRRLDAG